MKQTPSSTIINSETNASNPTVTPATFPVDTALCASYNVILSDIYLTYPDKSFRQLQENTRIHIDHFCCILVTYYIVSGDKSHLTWE